MKFLRSLMFIMMLAFAGAASAQAMDFEVRYEVGLLGSAPGFGGAARLNLPLGPELLGARLWVLPEVSFMVASRIDGYLRLQLLADAEGATFFVDAKYILEPDGGTRGTVWVGARFGIDFTQND